MPVFFPVPHSVDYCSIVLSFAIRGVHPPALFFFRIVLATWGPLIIPMNFRVDFYSSIKNYCVFIGIKLIQFV